MKTLNRKWMRMGANTAERAPRPLKPAGCLLCITALLLTGTASAQTATTRFNPAAREYIVGNTAAASNLVTSALMEYPDDEKLQKLKELIEQQQEQQDQQNQDQQNQDQQNQDQQNQDQQNQDQQNQDQQDQDQQQDPSDEKQEENQSQDSEQQDPQEAQPSEAQPQQAGEMSEEEAQQLLDSMKQNEKDQRSDLRPYLGQPVRVDKDW